MAGGFRRSELVALNLDDIELRPGGLLVHVRKSKTDQEQAGATIDIPYGSVEGTCPVRVYKAWLACLHAAGITTNGPVFRR
jgi:integrase